MEKLFLKQKLPMKFDLSHYHKRVFGETGLQGKKFGRVLDIGCGRGFEDEILAKWGNKVLGVDIENSPEWKKIQSEKVRFLVKDGENTKLNNNSFDLVFSKDVLHHTPNPKKMLEEAKRVCKKNGIICFVEANRLNPISYFHMTKKLGHNHFTQKQFTQLVKSAFPNAKIGSFEAHFYPFLPSFLLNLLARTEFLVSHLPFFKKWLSYNYFIANNTQ